MKTFSLKTLKNPDSKRVFLAALLSCALFLFAVGGRALAEDVIAPEWEIHIEQEPLGPAKPEWKKVWDRSRMLVRQNNLEEAKSSYEQLFTLKPNIVAATWEYCKLLVRLEEWEDSAPVIEGLLELEPYNQEFLLVGGEIALANNHFNRATEYFGQVLENDPVGPFSERATMGLIDALKRLENTKAVHLLLEQHVLRGNDDDASLMQLGQLSLDLKQYESAGKHYARLASRHPENKDFIYQLATIHEQRGDLNRAAKYWQNYLTLNPGFQPFHRKLVRYYLSRDNHQEAVVQLSKLYDLGGRQESDLALQIGNIYYDTLDRKDKALLYYERYGSSPEENPKVARRVESIRDSLAREYLPIVENNATDNLWRDLDVVTIDKALIFQRIARLLYNRKNHDAEKEVLEILHNHGQVRDLNLTYRLAELNIGAGKRQRAYELLSLLDKKGYGNKAYLLKKAELELFFHDEVQALQTYMRYLEYEPGDPAALREALGLAGNLGFAEEVNQLWQHIGENTFPAEDLFALELLYLEAMRKNSLYAQADQIYAHLFIEHGNNSSATSTLYYHLAETFKYRGFHFRAEQLYRQNIARNMQVERAMTELMRIALSQDQLVLARSWLDLLAERRGIDDLEDNAEELPEDLHFLYLEFLVGAQEYDDAIEQVESHVHYRNTELRSTSFAHQSALFLSRALFFQEEYKQCLQVLSELEVQHAYSAEIHVLKTIINSRLSQDMLVQPNTGGHRQVAMSERIERARLFQSHGEYGMALAEIELVLQRISESLVARILHIQLLAELSYTDEALTRLALLIATYPNEEYFTTLQLELEFQRGKFAEVVRKVPAKIKKIAEPGEVPTVQNSQDTYFYRSLLLARALWAENRKEEAFVVYNSLLAQPVDTVFLEKMELNEINFNLPPLKKPFWDILYLTAEESDDPMPMVMTPQFVTQNIGEPIDNLAAGLYGKYKWQELVKQELSAREAVQKRDYHAAEKKYLALLEKEQSPESIFDLAEIYDKLGLHGKAGELYQLMKEKGPLYPGLDESFQANYLKRQPRISAVLAAVDHQGRDGYINIKKRSYGVEGWVMPAFDQEFSVQAYFNEYRTSQGQESLRKQRLVGTYNTYFENSTDINLKVGIDTPEQSGTKELVFNFELFHRLDENIEIYGRYEQDILEDTLRSVTDSIIFRDFETGVKFDMFPRLFVGGDYRYRWYSDDNYQNRYKLWSQYHLFGELNQFKVKYSYEHLQHGDDNLGRENDFSNVFAPDDLVYWSPKNYWEQEITFHFRHYLDKTPHSNTLLNYCSIDYSWGYDKNSEQTHEIDVNILLEMSRHFLLRSNLRFLEGDDLEETQAFFSFIYRW